MIHFQLRTLHSVYYTDRTIRSPSLSLSHSHALTIPLANFPFHLFDKLRVACIWYRHYSSVRVAPFFHFYLLFGFVLFFFVFSIRKKKSFSNSSNNNNKNRKIYSNLILPNRSKYIAHCVFINELSIIYDEIGFTCIFIRFSIVFFAVG